MDECLLVTFHLSISNDPIPPVHYDRHCLLKGTGILVSG